MINIKSLQVEDKNKLLEYQSKLKTTPCNLCSYGPGLRDEYLFPVASSGTGRILVVGQQTFLEEHKTTMAMSGAFRTIFSNYLSKYTNLTENDCTFTYAVKCTSSDKNNVVKAKTLEYKNCSRFLLQDIKNTDPALIIFLGKDAAKSLISRKEILKQAAGVPFQARILGKMRWCYFMMNPIVAKTTTHTVPTVEAHFRGLYKFFDEKTDLYNNFPRPSSPEVVDGKKRNYIMVNTPEGIKEMLKELEGHTYIGMDTETNSLHTWIDDFHIVGVSLSVKEDEGYYLPVKHKVSSIPQLSWDKDVKPLIEMIIKDPTKQTIWHHLYYDYSACMANNLNIFKHDPANRQWTHDSMIMTYLANENPKLNLKEQMYLHFGIIPKKFKGVLEDADVNNFEEVDPVDAIEYAVDDAINCRMLFKKQAKEVARQSKLYTDGKLLNNIYPTELRVVKILADAHRKGIRIDEVYLKKLSLVVEADLRETKREIFKISTVITKMSSNTKLVDLLEDITNKDFLANFKAKYKEVTAQEKALNILIKGYTQYWDRAEKGGTDPSTQETYTHPGRWEPKKLEKYVKLLVRYKHLVKVKSTYVDAIYALKHKVEKDWIVHATIKSIGTTSGRMSSREPNLQNIPRTTPTVTNTCAACGAVFKDDDGIKEGTFTDEPTRSRYTCTRCGHVNKTYTYDLRRIYIPRDGMRFIAADYRNMELYLAAAVSGCQSLYDVFLKREKDPEDPNGDMHVVTASSILGITPDQWKELSESNVESDRKKAKEARTIAKTVNFLTLYGGSAQGLYETFVSMGVEKTAEECSHYIDAFFNAFPELKKWFDEQKYNIKNDGLLVNNYGRIRHVLKEGTESLSAINMMIQGLGAQIVKQSLIDAEDAWLDKLLWNILLIIHDENVLEVPEDDVESATASIKKIMEITVYDKLNVNLKVDPSSGAASLSKTEMD